jgi:hypothetical protein
MFDMRNRLILICSLAGVLTPPLVLAQECSRVADAIGRESVKSLQASDSLSMKKYDFCRFDYSKSNRDQQLQVEASYGVLSGKAGASSAELNEQQSKVCQGSFGLDFLKTLNTFDSSTVSRVGAAVVSSCLQQRSVRITDIAYAYPAMTFTVSNGTSSEVRIRDVAANPASLIESCDVKNTSGTFRKYLLPNNNAVVVCTLKELKKTGDNSQIAYGGGVITVDVPDSDMPPLPVPLVKTPELSATETRLRAQLAEAEKEMATLRQSVGNEQRGKQEAEKALQAANDTTAAWKQNALNRVTVATVGYGAIPGTVNIACPDWGKNLYDHAALTCGGAANAVVRVVDNHGGGACGLSVATILCK